MNPRFLARVEVAIIVLLACVPLFIHLPYRVNIFLARLCFRGIYFPMMGKLAWLKVVAQNRYTIFKLVKEACFGRRERLPRNPEGEISYEEAAATGPQVSA